MGRLTIHFGRRSFWTMLVQYMAERSRVVEVGGAGQAGPAVYRMKFGLLRPFLQMKVCFCGFLVHAPRGGVSLGAGWWPCSQSSILAHCHQQSIDSVYSGFWQKPILECLLGKTWYLTGGISSHTLLNPPPPPSAEHA